MTHQMGEYEDQLSQVAAIAPPDPLLQQWLLATLDNGDYIADHRDKLMGSFHVMSTVMNKIAPSLQPEIIAEW